MMFERTWTVRFSDADPHGIAHYPRIVDAIHETSDMFMEEISFPFWELSQERGFGLPLAAMDFEFHTPVEAGDRLTIGLTTSLSERSVRFDYVARNDDIVAFSGHEHRVCARTGDEESMKIPDELRARLAEYADE